MKREGSTRAVHHACVSTPSPAGVRLALDDTDGGARLSIQCGHCWRGRVVSSPEEVPSKLEQHHPFTYKIGAEARESIEAQPAAVFAALRSLGSTLPEPQRLRERRGSA
jgi:hypothetical protein